MTLDVLQAIIDADDRPIFALDDDFHYVAFNCAHAAAMREVYGAEIVLGGRLTDYQTIADDRATARANIGPALAGERVVVSAFAGEGERRRHYDLVHTPLTDDAGTVVGVVVRAVDTTERRGAENGLRESEARFRGYFEQSLIGAAVTAPDKGVIEVNEAFLDLIGYTRAELADKSWDELTHPDDVDADIAKFEAVIAGEIDGYRLTKRFIRKDGCAVDVDLNVRAVRNEQGEVEYFLALVLDISERKDAERVLREQAELIELAHDAIIVRDLGGHITFWSRGAQETYGWPAGEALGKVAHTLLEAAFPEPLEALNATLIEAGQWEGELSHSTNGGGRIIVDSRWSLRRDSRGDPIEVLEINRDVTEHRRATADLAAALERLRVTLAGTMTALGATVATRDPYTAGHERQVAQLACMIAERLGWDESRVETLRTAALVHDIGKIAVPSEILSKPGRLSEAEFALIMGHPEAAHDILAPIAFEDAVADIVVQHHERLDGSGYPAGLHADEILPEARVLAIADVVEAMLMHRPYRPALPVSEAIAEIRGGLGVRYDEAGGGACLALLEEGFSFAEE